MSLDAGPICNAVIAASADVAETSAATSADGTGAGAAKAARRADDEAYAGTSSGGNASSGFIGSYAGSGALVQVVDGAPDR